MRIFFKYVFFVLTLDKVNHMKQCVIPCLEGLLPVALESVVMDMLWTFLMWHALAKLHTHTETTVTILEHVTVDLGNAVRTFAHKCRKIDTRELPSEEAARGRRKAKVLSKQQLKARKAADAQKTGRKQTSKRKIINHHTFKLHNLPHYPGWIRRMGTTDNYSTQLVSPQPPSQESPS